ncbi:3-deoxy-manno-octulosonate cytidylyltransferase [Saccharophagus degradans]|uniref:3-deoxy-manno-octulosonate cytidylyltransferase n=1 Tax=Saccharophagus degradans TaxID=86304 RepID=UPI001C09C3B2|nr:3-deoxy-manno-octulosonate cytidylyltransferase [Saccharophagus degradans]MBU2985722.1 3-deoxy-manno-octulosonate cytidylyltransferase [Saccharophagus degradans]
MNFIVVIPARFASSRLPGKPLADIAGKPMIQWVYERAKLSDASKVIVATDNQQVFDTVKEFGGEVLMTSPKHESGTDRLQEVAQQLGLVEDEIIVNVQGDEPLIPPAVINQVAANIQNNSWASAATLSEPLVESEMVFDPNAVKVVSDVNGVALYFSRAPIPWYRDEYQQPVSQVSSRTDGLVQRHIGIYAYKVSLLNQFVQWPMSTLEAVEKLEQLRILSNGKKIHIAPSCELVPGGVDTQADLDRVRTKLKSS